MLGLNKNSSWLEVEQVMDKMEYVLDYYPDSEVYIAFCDLFPNLKAAHKEPYEAMKGAILLTENKLLGYTRFKELIWT